METVDLIIKNANEIVTLKGPNKPRIKKEMSELSIIKNGSIAIKNGKIFDIGKNLRYKADQKINASGKIVLPGFVDPHTHVVFGGSREFELNMKLKGFSYKGILDEGGGIYYTVNRTRNASTTDLINESQKRLDLMLRYGTTTCEAKSGYGLDTDSEIKILKIQEKLNNSHKMDIVSTFLGAHAIPKGIQIEDYVDTIVKEMIPKVKDLAIFCDVFCEEGFFNFEQSKRILEVGSNYGLKPKIHADEIVDTNGAKLASEVGAISADHLLMASDEGLKDMAKKGVIGVLLPGTPFSLMIDKYAPARKMIEFGVPVALATDLNPNCWTENMQFMMQLGCFKMKLTPAEAITAATFNAACAIDKNDNIGSLEKGKQADIVVLDCPNHQFIPYHFGVNLAEIVIKKGEIV